MTDQVRTIQLEVMLAGWSETHQAGVKITFWLADDADLEPFRMLTVKRGKVAGQRFMMVLALIEDDETMGDAKQRHVSSDMHLMVTGPQFLAYLQATQPTRLGWNSERAKRWAKHQADIESLSELDADPLKLKRFRDIVQRPFADWNDTHGQTGPDRSEDPGPVPLDEDSHRGD